MSQAPNPPGLRIPWWLHTHLLTYPRDQQATAPWSGRRPLQTAQSAASVYAGTKGAVDTITKSLAKELASRKIRVNAISPGLVITEGTNTAGILGSDFETQQIAATPLGRAGQPEDIAPPVSFLASDDARWITGETILVSGGAGM